MKSWIIGRWQYIVGLLAFGFAISFLCGALYVKPKAQEPSCIACAKEIEKPENTACYNVVLRKPLDIIPQQDFEEEEGEEEIAVSEKLAVLKGETPIFLYSSNSLTGDVTGMLPPQGAGIILVEGDDWYLLESGQYKGFVSKKDFIVGEAANEYSEANFEKQAIVSSKTAFLYEVPESESSVLTVYGKGAVLTLKSKQNSDSYFLVEGYAMDPLEKEDEEEVDWDAVMIEEEQMTGEASENSADNIEDEKESDSLQKVEGYLLKDDLEITPVYEEAVEPDLTVYSDYFPEEMLGTYESDYDYDVSQEIIISDEDYENGYSLSCQAVVDYAMQFLGNPYVWGGESLTSGCDCSGFVKAIYEHFGIALPKGSYALRACGQLVTTSFDTEVLKPGDILCYEGHCGIYIGDGNMIHAANEKLGIIISKIDHRDDLVCVRRVLLGHTVFGEDISEEDYDALCRIVEAEAGTEGLQGKVYVADVILNRVKSPKFKNTIQGVILSPHQFQPVSNGRYYRVRVTDETKKAVDYALTHTDSTQGALYFMVPEYSDKKNVSWFYSSLTYLFSYKKTEFFR